MSDAIATLRARLPPGPLADAVQALIESARDVGRFHADSHTEQPQWQDSQSLNSEAAALTALLDLLAPMSIKLTPRLHIQGSRAWIVGMETISVTEYGAAYDALVRLWGAVEHDTRIAIRLRHHSTWCATSQDAADWWREIGSEFHAQAAAKGRGE